jgi:hypothetical protein
MGEIEGGLGHKKIMNIGTYSAASYNVPTPQGKSKIYTNCLMRRALK